ncbi:MAG: 3-oxoacyl-[acyl-carrier-protein] synthase [Myxococcaceae bacterium]|nr:3-oxoacyl-[acyl-carrier-protein] synthase [Myxococcaceae bacterium]
MLPLAITGLGIVSPLGIGRSEFLAALSDPVAAKARAFSGAHRVLTDARFQHAQVAEVPDFDAAQYLGDKGLRNLDRATKMLVVAAKHALEDAGLKRDGEFTSMPKERIGICAATAYGSLDSITEINRVAELEHPRYLNPSRFPNTVINAAAGYVSIWEGLEGPNVTVVDGNCGGADVVLTAETHLACGRGDAFLVGGFEVLNEPLYLAFVKLGVIVEGDQLSSPGEVASRGTHLGEGAAMMVVEPLLEARERGATVLAELVGFGSAFEPPASAAQLVHASDKAVERAVVAALLDAGLERSDIDLVLCSESGVNRMDMAEEEGLARALGSDVATLATKALWGETFGASAALSIAASLAWFSGVTPAPLLRGELTRSVRTVLVTAMGYYGNVSVVIVRKANEA